MKIAKTRAQVSSQTTLSRAHSPHGAPTAGTGAYFTGANILTDPGFENFVYGTGGWHWPPRPDGHSNYTLPQLDVSCDSYLRYPDGTCATGPSLPGWAQANPYSATLETRYDQAWKVSTDDPHSGDYHAVWWKWDAAGLVPAEICAFSPFIQAPFSARVQPGDAITWSAYLKTPVTTGTPAAFPYVRFFNQSFTIITTVLGTVTNLTTSYAQLSVSTNAPSGSYYIRACFGFSGGTSNTYPVYFDTAVLGVQ